MRAIAAPFGVAAPVGARVGTRRRVDAADGQVVGVVGAHLGGLAGSDLAARCRLGRGDGQRAARKRALPAVTSSRWVGASTRTWGERWQRAVANLLDARIGRRRAAGRMGAGRRVAVGSGGARWVGPQLQAERFQQQRRRQHPRAELAKVEARIGRAGLGLPRPPARQAAPRPWPQRCVGGRGPVASPLAGRAVVAHRRWRGRHGVGNQTIRVHPTRVAAAAAADPAGAPVEPARPGGDRPALVPGGLQSSPGPVAAQAASGAVGDDLALDSARAAGRWLRPGGCRPALGGAIVAAVAAAPGAGVDLDAEQLDCWRLDPSGNPVGTPHTIPLQRAGLPAAPATAGCASPLPPASAAPRCTAAVASCRGP
jgi:hypothetical protein